jgi:hypothetical protein
MIGASYAGMPYEEVERNLRCFVERVLPEVKRWETEPLAQPEERSKSAAAASA